MVARSISSILFVCSAVFSCSFALVACGDDDASPVDPGTSKAGSTSGGSAGTGGATAGNGGTAGATAGAGGAAAGAGGSSAGAGGASAGAGGAGAAAGAAGAGGAAAGAGGSAGAATTSATCKRIADVKGQLDASAFVTFGTATPFCLVGVHAIDGDISSDYGTVGRLGTTGKLVSNLKAKPGYVLWAPPAATPENATASLGKGTEIAVGVDGVPAGAFFGTPSGDDTHAYLSYTGAAPEFAGELFQISLADGTVTGKATANGLYAVAPGAGPNDVFFTGLSNLGAAKTVPGNNGVFRASCAAGACTSKAVKQWGDNSGPIDADTTGNVFVAHGAFGGDQIVSAFNGTATGESAVADVYTGTGFVGSLAAVAQHVVLAASDATTFAQLPLSFFTYIPGSPVATLSPLQETSQITPVGTTTLAVVGGNPATKELWIIADSNGFAGGGKTVFLRLEPVGTIK